MQNLRNIPKIDKFIQNKEFENLNGSLILKLSKTVINQKRERILSGNDTLIDEKELVQQVLKRYYETVSYGTKPLINATGVIVHTNLGRSPISKEIFNRAKELVCGYSNLEYNLLTAIRGERYEEINRLFKILFDIEDVLVVNNNAAAVFLILNTFAKEKEVVVSRGELVEIGGSFRIPEVMRESGAILREVGTTNKTNIGDYENAINEKSSILMKVHKSNFTIEGFSQSVEFKNIHSLAQKNGLIDYFDLGSGHIGNLPYSLSHNEPEIEKILKEKPSLISFSGDKLFGSVQAGIIFGKKELIAKLKKNQLLRMLRVDKVTLALLEESVKAYIMEDYDKITTKRLLHTETKELRARAENMASKIGDNVCEVIDTFTYVGGGTMPNKKIPSIALKFSLSPTFLERAFRECLVIGRVENEAFLLDFRSIDKDEDEKLLEIICRVLRCFE